MSADIVYLFPPEPGPKPNLTVRLASRRAYRRQAAEVAARCVAEAFTASAKGIDIGCDDALPIFVAAMRRELRKSGCL
jgi:hypothetical protein